MSSTNSGPQFPCKYCGELYAHNSSRSRHHRVCLLGPGVSTTPSRSNLHTPILAHSMQFSAMQSTPTPSQFSPFSDFDLGSTTPMQNLVETTSVSHLPACSTLSVAMSRASITGVSETPPEFTPVGSVASSPSASPGLSFVTPRSRECQQRRLTAASARCADAQQAFQQIYPSSTPKPSNLFKTPRRVTTPMPYSSDDNAQLEDSPVSEQLGYSDFDGPFMADSPPKKKVSKENQDLKVIKHREASSLSAGLMEIVREHFKEQQWSVPLLFNLARSRFTKIRPDVLHLACVLVIDTMDLTTTQLLYEATALAHDAERAAQEKLPFPHELSLKLVKKY